MATVWNWLTSKAEQDDEDDDDDDKGPSKWVTMEMVHTVQNQLHSEAQQEIGRFTKFVGD